MLFDVNSSDNMQQFIRPSFQATLAQLESNTSRGYTLTVVRNQQGEQFGVEAVSRVAGGASTGRQRRRPRRSRSLVFSPALRW